MEDYERLDLIHSTLELLAVEGGKKSENVDKKRRNEVFHHLTVLRHEAADRAEFVENLEQITGVRK